MSSTNKTAKGSKAKGGAKPSMISDPRFAKFETDPRYLLPSRKKNTEALDDDRFGLADEQFTKSVKLDRYGRKIKTDKQKKALERLYGKEGLKKGKGKKEKEGAKKETKEKKKKEEEEEEEGEEEGEEESHSDSESNSDDDEVHREMERLGKNHDPARGGGFLHSDSESDSDSDSDLEANSGSDDSDSETDSDADSDEVASNADTQRYREEAAKVPTGEVTRRLAIVNLDWDNIKSEDLMALFSSFVPKETTGRIEKISIYPSAFGRERMQREEVEGPPRELFKNKGDDSESESESEDDSEDDSDDSAEDEKIKNELLKEEDDREMDSNALRAYQLDRLRYYYAVMVCSDKATAEALYRATDGSEYQSSSNFIDLRFIPDDVTFDDATDGPPRDECDALPANYRPIEFVTDALQHSKVKLTWDLHPDNRSRKDIMQRAFSGTPADLIENDLNTYLASDSEEEGYDAEEGHGEEDDEEFAGFDDAPASRNGAAEKSTGQKLDKKELARRKMRAALGLPAEPMPAQASEASKNTRPTNAQITFIPALNETKTLADEGEETTLEKYKRKEKDRKEKRKQKSLAKREGRDLDEEEDEEDSGDEQEETGEDLGFDDPFFATEPDEDPFGDGSRNNTTKKGAVSKTQLRKEERLKKREARDKAEAEDAAQKAALSHLLDDDDNDEDEEIEDYNLLETIKANKKAKSKKGKKGKRGKAIEDDEDDDDDFDLDTTDARFQDAFVDPDAAIDQNDPHFVAEPNVKKLMAKMRRKHRLDDEEEEAAHGATRGKAVKKARKVVAST